MGSTALTVCVAATCVFAGGCASTREAPLEAPGRIRSASCEDPPLQPYDRPPELTNLDEVFRALSRAYPAELRDAGIGGRALLCIVIDERGQPRGIEFLERTGSEGLDIAAADVARTMRFRPAEALGQPVPIKWTMPISFQIR